MDEFMQAALEEARQLRHRSWRLVCVVSAIAVPLHDPARGEAEKDLYRREVDLPTSGLWKRSTNEVSQLGPKLVISRCDQSAQL